MNNSNCLECGINISPYVKHFSIEKYGIPLCVDHQYWIDKMALVSTPESIRLYFALKARGVPAQLEKFDGYKHIDIAIPQAKINIEVDGIHHNYSTLQALSDLRRTYYSFLKGFYTIRIPNSLVRGDDILQETADCIVALLNESVKHDKY
jgi:Uncharacterized protein conserved in bacteria